MWVCDGLLPPDPETGEVEPCDAVWRAPMMTCPTCRTVGPLRVFGSLPKDADHRLAKQIPHANVPRAPKTCDQCGEIKQVSEFDISPHTLRHETTCRACGMATVEPPPSYASKRRWVVWAEAAGHVLNGSETKDDLIALTAKPETADV